MGIEDQIRAVLSVLREQGVTRGKIETRDGGGWTLEFTMTPDVEATTTEATEVDPLSDLTRDPAAAIMAANQKRASNGI